MSGRLVCWPDPSEACARGVCRWCRRSAVSRSRNQIARAVGLDRWSVAVRAWTPPVRTVALEPEPDVPVGQWHKPRHLNALLPLRQQDLDDIDGYAKAWRRRRRP